jgi:hypothetical protein
MALQAILVRAGEALPGDRWVIELDVDGEHVEVVLGPEPSAAARLSTDADVRVRVPTETISDLLLGRPFDATQFIHESGDAAAHTALLRAIGSA